MSQSCIIKEVCHGILKLTVPNKSFVYCTNQWSNIRKYSHKGYQKMSDEPPEDHDQTSQEDISASRIIGTHSGKFHSDEVLACFLLKQLPSYKNAKIFRSRDNEKLITKCNIIVDVCGIFDPERKIYDHHQDTFQETLSSLRPEYGSDFNIRLSSAGLIYAYYGEKVVNTILKDHKNVKLPPAKLKCVFREVYKMFIREIDAIDNGMPMSNEEPAYAIRTGINDRIAKLNPSWDEKNVDEDERFEKALNIIGKEFTTKVIEIGTSWINARKFVVTAIETAKSTHETGEILYLESICPWRDHLSDLEKEYGIEGFPKYVMSGKGNKWHVLAVQCNALTQHCRKPFPESWRGLKEEKLSEAAGIPNLIFCHYSGHIAIAKNQRAALEIAVKSLKAPN